MSGKTHTIDSRLAGKMGYYVNKHEFVVFSFDEAHGEYFIQYGYTRPNGQAQERESAQRRLVQPGSVISQLSKLVDGGYKLEEAPKGFKIRSINEVRTKVESAPKAPAEPVLAPVVELLDASMVKIAKQVMKIREGEFNYVPRKNDAYFFPEHTNDVILDIQEKKAVLLTGHTGCGKTSLIEQIASRINQPVLRSNMNGQTTVGDFVGMWTVKAGTMNWIDGVLPKAMREGYWIVIDEIDCADASILATLNAVLEKNGVLTLKEKDGEVITPHENFRIFATANTVGCMAVFRSLYQGTNLMNEAFIDRFRVYLADYMPEKEEVKVLIASVPKLRIEVATQMVRVASAVRTAFTKEEVSCTFSTRRLIDWAEMYARHGQIKSSAQAIIYSKISPEDKKVIEGLIVRIGEP